MDRPDLRGNWRQSSTLLMSGDGNRGGASASVLAPILDSTKLDCCGADSADQDTCPCVSGLSSACDMLGLTGDKVQ
jgi:hypothetical protein